jgi:hypothetical protein
MRFVTEGKGDYWTATGNVVDGKNGQTGFYFFPTGSVDLGIKFNF